MSRIQNYRNVNDPAFLGSLNEELSETRRRVERQAEKYQRLTQIKVGMTQTAIAHQLGTVPRSVAIEIIETTNPFTYPDVWFAGTHTTDQIFLRASIDTVVDVVLRG